MRQRLSGLSCIHRTPAGLPFGMPGIGDEIDSAIQQAPQPILQSTLFLLQLNKKQEAHCDGSSEADPSSFIFWVRSMVENTYLPHLPFISATSSLSIPIFL